MMLKNLCILIIASFAFVLFACNTGSNGPSLTLQSFPETLAVGDTTPFLFATKKARDVQGRMETNPSYYDFELVSSDSAVALIVQHRRILGMTPGHVFITARDNNVDLSSGQYTITVK